MPKYIRIRVCMCMGIRNICVHVCHVQMMNSWICQGDENVCMWVYTHMCMCIRSCICKSRHVQIIVSWISQQHSVSSQQTCDALRVESRRGASVRSQPCRRVGPSTAPLQGLGLDLVDLVLYKFAAPHEFLKPHANHMNSHLHIILYSAQTIAD